MSETSIEAYSITAAELENNIGSGSEDLVKQIIVEEEGELEDCASRFENWDEETLTPEEAVRAVINGTVLDEHVYECTCVLAPILMTIGSFLRDETSERSLNYNMDYWDSDFHKVFLELGLNVLANAWENSSFSLTESGETAEWPAVSFFDKTTLEKCKSEFEGIQFKEAFDALPKELFTQKTEDDTGYTMQCNIECLQNWISKCVAEKKCLFLIFDGDT